MKLLLNRDQKLVDIDLDIDPATGICNPQIDAFGYHIEGPATKMAFVRDDTTGGLLLTIELPEIIEAAVAIDKDDVKKLKGLMNKDAIKFMVKALM